MCSFTENVFSPGATGFQWHTILKSTLIGLIINQFVELLKCENVEVGEHGTRCHDIPHSWRVTTQWDNVIGVFHWGCSLIGWAMLIQNNEDVHHPDATGTTAVTAASYTVCVHICMYMCQVVTDLCRATCLLLFCLLFFLPGECRLLFGGYQSRCQKHPRRLFMQMSLLKTSRGCHGEEEEMPNMGLCNSSEAQIIHYFLCNVLTD